MYNLHGVANAFKVSDLFSLSDLHATEDRIRLGNLVPPPHNLAADDRDDSFPLQIPTVKRGIP
jgi:hypothetical protein